MPPYIRHRQRDVFGERARPVHTHALGMCAQVPASGEAVPALAANHVTLAAHDIAVRKAADIRPGFNDLADKLVPDDQPNRYRLSRPVVPLVDVKVCPADTRDLNPDQDVIDADRGLRGFFQAETASACRLY